MNNGISFCGYSELLGVVLTSCLMFAIVDSISSSFGTIAEAEAWSFFTSSPCSSVSAVGAVDVAVVVAALVAQKPAAIFNLSSTPVLLLPSFDAVAFSSFTSAAANVLEAAGSAVASSFRVSLSAAALVICSGSTIFSSVSLGSVSGSGVPGWSHVFSCSSSTESGRLSELILSVGLWNRNGKTENEYKCQNNIPLRFIMRWKHTSVRLRFSFSSEPSLSMSKSRLERFFPFVGVSFDVLRLSDLLGVFGLSVEASGVSEPRFGRLLLG